MRVIDTELSDCTDAASLLYSDILTAGLKEQDIASYLFFHQEILAIKQFKLFNLEVSSLYTFDGHTGLALMYATAMLYRK